MTRLAAAMVLVMLGSVCLATGRRPIVIAEFRPTSRGAAWPMTVTGKETVHQVLVYGADRIAGRGEDGNDHPDREEVRKLLFMWARVLDLLPAPNSDQTPEVYRLAPQERSSQAQGEDRGRR